MTHLLYPGNEHVIDAVVAKLIDSLDAYIAAINDRDTKGIVLGEVPADRIFDYPPTIREIVDFPALGVAELPSGGWTQDVGDDATAEHAFAIICFDQDPEQQRLTTKLRRLRQAVYSCVMDGRKIDHPTDPMLGAWGVRFEGYRPGRTLGIGDDPRSWISWTSVAFTALAEDHPT